MLNCMTWPNNCSNSFAHVDNKIVWSETRRPRVAKTQPWVLVLKNLGSNEIRPRNIGLWG